MCHANRKTDCCQCANNDNNTDNTPPPQNPPPQNPPPPRSKHTQQHRRTDHANTHAPAAPTLQHTHASSRMWHAPRTHSQRRSMSRAAKSTIRYENFTIS